MRAGFRHTMSNFSSSGRAFWKSHAAFSARVFDLEYMLMTERPASESDQNDSSKVLSAGQFSGLT